MSNNVAVVLCRSIQKRNKEERSNFEMLLGILGNPWVEVDPNTAAPARYIPTVNPETEAGPIVTKNPEMERMADASSSRRRLCLSSERPWLQGLLGDRTTGSAEPRSPHGKGTILHTRSVSKTC